MKEIHLSDEAFKRAEAVAESRGFDSVEDLLTDILDEEAKFVSGVPDSFFTPAILAEIDKGIAEANAGRLHSLVEVREHFRQKSKAWRQDQAS